LSERYGNSRPPHRDYDDRPRQGTQRPAGAGYNTNSRYAQSGRPASRPPQNGRPSSRPPQNGRKPVSKRKKKSAAPTIILIIVILLVIAAGIVIAPKLLGNKTDITNPNTSTAATVNQNVVAQVTASPNSAVADNSADLHAYLAGEDNDMQGLTSEQLVEVTDLSINESLPEEWENVLLLGIDSRSTAESARSDTMMICSINKNTGEVKLTSIMRDLAVEMDDLGELSDTYRINAANFFGGPRYAMKVVNECFDMNIEHYVAINFYGFQEIAHALGGITVDITKDEMVEINRYVWDAHTAAEKAGVEDVNRIPLVELFDYGQGVQLDGRQTLSYARIRKLDNDYARSGRQREVLSKLALKLKEKSPAEVTMILAGFMPYVSTNMEVTEGIGIAMKVLQGDVGNIESFRLPINGSFSQETQNEKSMMYDCDWAINARDLYTFIYS